MAIPDPWIPTDGKGVALAGRTATPIRVRRYDAEAGFGDMLTEVVPVEVRDGLGPEPAVARLRYRFTGAAAPYDAFEAVSTATGGTQVVRTGDRLVIEAQDLAEVWHPIFDGFAYGFELHADGYSEAANVACVGVACRCYNTPIGGAIYRPGPDYDDKSKYVITDQVAHFNPKGEGNRLPDAFEPLGNASKYCSLFVDVGAKLPDPDEPDDPDKRHSPSLWGVHDAAAYVLYTSNDQSFVANPLRSTIDECLQAHVPKAGQDFDPTQPGTYDVKPIAVADKPVSGKAWPSMLHQVLGDKGFTFRWSLSAGEDGRPATAFEPLRTDTLASKSIYLQPRGEDLDPLLSNMSRASMTRDVTEAVNVWSVEGQLVEHEASFVLADGFPVDPADATNLSQFYTSSTDPRVVDAERYRLFIFDEAGEGHWAPGDSVSAKVTDVSSLDAIFGEPVNDGNGNLVPRYAVRRRKPYADLVSRDEDGKPLKARLDYSTDYRADEMQKVAFTAPPTGGSFTLSVTIGGNTYTTSALPYNASANQVAGALEALEGVSPGDVAVSGSVAAGFTVQFIGNLGAQSQALMSSTGSLTGGSVSTSRLLAGAAGAAPAVWDGSGTWHPIQHGWELLKDRIGVRFEGQNPNGWHTGEDGKTVLKLVEALAAPTDGNPKVTLRLTCTVRADARLKGVASDIYNNARPDTLARVVDAHDRYEKQVLCKNSKFNLLSDDILVRDDSELAKAEATAMQFATQAGILDGSVTIPYFSTYYRPGDRISDINGRSLSLRTDGMGSRSTPVYPVILRRTWRLDGEQRTILELSDASTARAGYMRRGHGQFAHQNYLGGG